MAELKTKANDSSVDDFLASISDEQQRIDSQEIIEIMSSITSRNPVMWGGSIIGFGDKHLKYESGRELEWFNIGFSPRKGKISLYLTFDADDLTGQFQALGKYKTGKGCIYINKLDDIDRDELKKLIETAYSESAE